jgi:hypothetical protein
LLVLDGERATQYETAIAAMEAASTPEAVSHAQAMAKDASQVRRWLGPGGVYLAWSILTIVLAMATCRALLWLAVYGDVEDPPADPDEATWLLYTVMIGVAWVTAFPLFAMMPAVERSRRQRMAWREVLREREREAAARLEAQQAASSDSSPSPSL